MAEDAFRARDDGRTSWFPAHEGPSFCSRPTPVVPSHPDLDVDPEGIRPDGRESRPSLRPSERPTFVPDDYVEPRLESPPTVTIEGDSALDAAQPSPSAANVTAPLRVPTPPPLPRSTATPGPVPAVAERAAGTGRPRGRMLFARVLFVLLFGGVGSLLAYAFEPRLAAAFEHAHASDARPPNALK